MNARESPSVECILSLLALFCSLLIQILNLNICVIVFTQLVTFTHTIPVYLIYVTNKLPCSQREIRTKTDSNYIQESGIREWKEI